MAQSNILRNIELTTEMTKIKEKPVLIIKFIFSI